jgi:hypothetical protein
MYRFDSFLATVPAGRAVPVMLAMDVLVFYSLYCCYWYFCYDYIASEPKLACFLLLTGENAFMAVLGVRSVPMSVASSINIRTVCYAS